ncbi:hypothetical protein HYPSUDRAFT_209611 [Hypholoma sublateritium FD-334 SS-4]|uniref:Uncharacterized protein n=1 Tax=Hypholoma sublateritium (strain FD-334 SS-4) TaxID=945553 RepID=A0A0D2LR96_HYPSF|nr:hypothetical protein HYPSUDRAFT_209611 [Hypholoma sublateritium FD-334 SS-4]
MYNSYLDYYKSAALTAFKDPPERAASEPDTDHAPGEELYHEDVAVDEVIAGALDRPPAEVIFEFDTVSLGSVADTELESKAPTEASKPSKLQQDRLAPPGATFKGVPRSAGDGTRISAVRRKCNNDGITSIFVGDAATKPLDTLYKSSELRSHVSLIIFDDLMKKADLLASPELRVDLPGGLPAVESLWALFKATAKSGISILASTLGSGGYWSARQQADVIIEDLATDQWFKDLYRAVEGGPLAEHFVGPGIIPWKFNQPITSASKFMYWFSGQFAMFVSRFFDFKKGATTELHPKISDYQGSVIRTVRFSSREALVTYETAGLKIPRCGFEGSYTVARAATHILRAIGCVGHGRGPQRIQPKPELAIHLYVAESTEKMTNNVINTLGSKNVAIGFKRVLGTVDKLPYTILALAATIIEIELRVLRNLPAHNGELAIIASLMEKLSGVELKILSRHRKALEEMEESECYPELSEAINKIRRAFRLNKINLDPADVFYHDA